MPRRLRPPFAPAINPGSPHARGLILACPMDGTRRSFVRSSGLTIAGAPAPSAHVDVGAAWTFDGTDDAFSVAINLAPFRHIALSFWLNWTTFGSDDDLAFEYSANYNSTAGFIVDPNSSSGGGPIDFGVSTGGGQFWVDGFTRPSAGVWHHYLLAMDRTTPVNQAWVDGVSQSLTPSTHNAIGTDFANSTLYLMSRAAASLFGQGSMTDVRIYDASACLDLATLARQLYQPETRWKLYDSLRARGGVNAAAGGVTSILRQMIQHHGA